MNSKKKLLIIEGKDDLAFILALLCKAFPDFRIQGYDLIIGNKCHISFSVAEGHINAKKQLKSAQKRFEEYSHICIILDADESLENQWESVKSNIDGTFYQIPDSFSEDGSIIKNEKYPNIGIWIMPDNKNDGMLEDLAIQSIEDDLLLPYAKKAVVELPVKRFKPTFNSKSIIHTWLAWQEYPNADLYKSVANNYLNLNHVAIVKLQNWLIDFFEINICE